MTALDSFGSSACRGAGRLTGHVMELMMKQG
jgi:hypothetical protein